MEVKPSFTGNVQEDLEYLIEVYELTAVMLKDRQENAAARLMQTVIGDLIRLKDATNASATGHVPLR